MNLVRTTLVKYLLIHSYIVIGLDREKENLVTM